MDQTLYRPGQQYFWTRTCRGCGAVNAELGLAETAYLQAQQELESFVAENQTDSLNRQISENRNILDSLQSAKEEAILAVTGNDRDLRLNLFKKLIEADADATYATLDQQVQQQLDQLSLAYAAQSAARRQLEQARLLETQIQNGGDAAAATNALALQLLKARVFASDLTPAIKTPQIDSANSLPNIKQNPIENSLPADIQFSLENSGAAFTAAEQAADAAALATTLEAHIAALDDQIDSLSQQLLAGDTYQFLEEIGASEGAGSSSEASPLAMAIAASYNNLFEIGPLTQRQLGGDVANADSLSQIIEETNADIQQLEARLEAENGSQLQAIQQRDLAWNTFDTLSNQAVELNLERTAANSEVRLGTPAMRPTPQSIG